MEASTPLEPIAGTFQLKLLSNAFDCSFSYVGGEAPTFQYIAQQSGPFDLFYDGPKVLLGPLVIIKITIQQLLKK